MSTSEDFSLPTITEGAYSAPLASLLRREIKHREEQVLKKALIDYRNNNLTPEQAILRFAELAGLHQLLSDLERQINKSIAQDAKLLS